MLVKYADPVMLASGRLCWNRLCRLGFRCLRWLRLCRCGFRWSRCWFCGYFQNRSACLLGLRRGRRIFLPGNRCLRNFCWNWKHRCGGSFRSRNCIGRCVGVCFGSWGEVAICVDCWLSAFGFLLRIEKLCRRKWGECVNQNRAIILPIPAMVNSAFSVELFLKAVIKEKTSECRSHKLSDLFNRLPIKIQQEIMNETNYLDFETQIERFSDAFVDFRYIYEDIFKTKDLNLRFWEDFSSAIYKIVPTYIARKGAPLYIDPSIK